MLAILDHPGPDSGTSWECGCAYKCGRPIVGLRTDFRPAGDNPDRPVNLMLAMSCKEVYEVLLDKRGDLEHLAQHAAEPLRRAVGAPDAGTG